MAVPDKFRPGDDLRAAHRTIPTSIIEDQVVSPHW